MARSIKEAMLIGFRKIGNGMLPNIPVSEDFS